MAKRYAKKKMLTGSFYAPYGFEAVLRGISPDEVNAIIAKVMRHLYSDFLDRRQSNARSLAMHFRCGNIFASEAIHNWYVQPPASFYIKALLHALERESFDTIHLVYEDRQNPAIEILESFLLERNIPFISKASDLKTDFLRLTSAQSMIASYSTFVECAALLSQRVASYYSFRRLESQWPLVPFLQIKVGEILRAKKVRCFIVHDFACNYIADRQWAASAEQLELLKNFDIGDLHLFEA